MRVFPADLSTKEYPQNPARMEKNLAGEGTKTEAKPYKTSRLMRIFEGERKKSQIYVKNRCTTGI
jgi:hypothetical protein